MKVYLQDIKPQNIKDVVELRCVCRSIPEGKTIIFIIPYHFVEIHYMSFLLGELVDIPDKYLDRDGLNG